MLYLFIFFTSLLVTIFSTPYLITFLVRHNIVDIPGGRRINTSAIPRMGGILIYAIIILSLLIYTRNNEIFRFTLISSAVLAVCGILDDTVNLKWNIKFLMQSFSAAIIIAYIYPLLNRVELFGTVLPFPLDIIFLFVFLTGLLNALNMLDGMDGLVSGFSLLQFLLIFIFSFNIGNFFLVILSLAAIGSLIGFLKFNANPAKIFLGDTGSLILGFFLGISLILMMHSFNPVSLDMGFPVILLGVPFIDTLRVMTIRLWNGKSVFYPDKNHIHHLISGNNVRHKTTVFLIQAFTLFFIFLSLVYLFYDKLTAYILFCISGIILSMLHPLLSRLKKYEKLRVLMIKMLPAEMLTDVLYKKYLLPFSAAAVIGLILVLFPSDSNISVDIILLMLTICVLLFAASLISLRRNHAYNDLYVLLNLFLFFSISSFSKPFIKLGSELGNGILHASVLLVLAVFMLFFSRYRSFKEKSTLFTGIDLIMLVLLVLLIIIENFLAIKALVLFEGNFLAGFTVYIWYKMVMVVKPSLSRTLFYSTFALPFVTLFVIWL